jgi:hypothetical protein
LNYCSLSLESNNIGCQVHCIAAHAGAVSGMLVAMARGSEPSCSIFLSF